MKNHHMRKKTSNCGFHIAESSFLFPGGLINLLQEEIISKTKQDKQFFHVFLQKRKYPLLPHIFLMKGEIFFIFFPSAAAVYFWSLKSFCSNKNFHVISQQQLIADPRYM